MKKVFGILLIMAAAASSVFAAEDAVTLVENIESTQKQINALNAAYERKFADHRNKITELEKQINEKEAKSDELNKSLKELEDAKNTYEETEAAKNIEQDSEIKRLRDEVLNKEKTIKKLAEEATDDANNKEAKEKLKKNFETSIKAIAEKSIPYTLASS